MKKKIVPSFEEGMKALKHNNLYLAETIFQELIKKNGNDLNAKFALARVYLEDREPYKARAVFSQIVENTSNRINSSIELGKDAIDKGEWNKVGHLLDNSIALLGPNIRARNYLKRLYFHTREYDKRKQLLNEDAMIDELSFNSNFMVGVISSGEMSKQEAKDYLDDFAKPHLTHLPIKMNYYDLIRNNFEDVPFTILPNGKPTFKQLVSDDVPYKPRPDKSRTTYSEELSIENRLEYLFAKNPSHGYKGIDKFSGYVIFEYKDMGVCVLEKFYSKTRNNTTKQSTENATYIFPINMTMQLSQSSKSDIISMMKTQPFIGRVIHNSHYYENIETKLKQVRLAYLEHNEKNDLNKAQFKQMDNIISEADFRDDDHEFYR